MNKELPWNKRLRRVEFRPPYANPEQLTGYLKEMDANLFVSSAMDASTGYALYPSEMSPMSKLVDKNYIADLIRLCHDSDIMVFSWYSPRENTLIWEENPQWRMMVKENDSEEAHMFKNALCYISSPYKEWLAKHLEEVVRSLDIDGLFFDGSTIGWYSEAYGCYCDSCKSAFYNETGCSIPEKIDWDNPDTRLFINWRYEKHNQWLLDLRDRLLNIKSDLALELNVLNRPHIVEKKKGFDWKTGIRLHTLPERIISGSESDSGIYRLCSATQAAAHSRAMNPTSWNLWMPAVSQVFLNRDSFWFCEDVPPINEFKIHAALVMSKGGIPWYGVDVLTQTKRQSLKEAFEFIKKMEKYTGGVPVKDVAIHMSGSARDYYGKQDAEKYFQGVLGFFEAVTELHYPVDFILDDQLIMENIQKYRVLVLSNSACLTQKQVDDLRLFVKNGGTLIASHYTSILGENNKVMDNFALSDLIGADFGDFADEAGDGMIEFIGRNPIYGGVSILNRASCICVKIPEKSTAEVLAVYSPHESAKAGVQTNKASVNYFEIQTGPARKPVMVQNTYGCGQVYYCGFDIGGAYLNNPFPGTRKIIGEMIKGRNDAPIRFIAPKSLEFSVMESCDGKKLYIHAINAPATSVKTPGWHTLTSVVDEILPIYGIVAEIRGRNVTKAVNALTGRNYDALKDESGFKILFDCADVYEIIIVE